MRSAAIWRLAANLLYSSGRRSISHYSPLSYFCLASILHSREVPDRAAVGGSVPGIEVRVAEKP